MAITRDIKFWFLGVSQDAYLNVLLNLNLDVKSLPSAQKWSACRLTTATKIRQCAQLLATLGQDPLEEISWLSGFSCF